MGSKCGGILYFLPRGDDFESTVAFSTLIASSAAVFLGAVSFPIVLCSMSFEGWFSSLVSFKGAHI